MEFLKLLGDQALSERDENKKDGLGFETYSKVLGDAALGTPGPFTIGIFGEWGTGKTSLMRLTQNYLNPKSKVVTVWFNAWRYEKEEHPIVPLIATIINELDLHASLLKKVDKKLSSLVRALRAVAYGFASKAKVKVPGFAEIEASFVAKDMIERREKITADPLLDQSIYYNAFSKLNELDRKESTKIVVFIDDLDRCFPDQAIRLLESIKLVLSQPGFIFVLGVARKIIEGYLQHRYEKEYGLKDFEGKSYLDKIVQLPFHIPPHIERVHQFSESVLKQLALEDRDSFREILPTIASTAGGNPRATIRFVNNLLIDRAINNALADANEIEIIPIEYFAVTRTLQQRWPDIFSILITSEDLAKNVATWEEKEILNNAKSDKSDYALVANRLITERDLRQMLLSTYGKKWLEEETLRTASHAFIKQRQQEAKGYSEDITKSYDLFISYNQEDRESVRELVDKLVEAELNVFFDALSLLPGQDWETEVRQALSNSSAILVCIGPGINKQGFVQKEWNTLLDLMQKSPSEITVIPVLLPGSNPDSIPSVLRNRNSLDLRDEKYEKAITQIKRVLV